jgi:DNA-binding NarL/FixJ family response regulator
VIGAGQPDGEGEPPAAEPPLRVVVADDQTAVREGLVTILGLTPGISVVGAAADGAAAVELATQLHPDVVLMDLRMPGVGGVEATRQIRARCPGSAVVVLTTYADDESVLAALAAGATGYLTKDAGREDIRRALVAASHGQHVLDPAAHQRLLEAAARAAGANAGAGGRGEGGAPGAPPELPLPDGLSPREGEVLSLIAEGLSNREIAARLYLSEVTVKTHVNRIFAKTSSSSRAQAIVYARRHGIGA